MSDYADEIVNNAMEHSLVLDDDGRPEMSHSAVVAGVVFCRCSQGCNVSVGTDDFDQVIFRAEEAEARHRLYVAVTQTTERLTAQQAVKSSERLITEDEMVPFTEADFERAKELLAKAGDPCPACGAAMVQTQGGVECISDHK